MGKAESAAGGREPTPETADGYAELFDAELIEELTGGRGRVVSREPLLAEIIARLDEPDCRIVLLVGGAGAGKTGVLAELARRNRDWPRYFVRRAAEPETAYQHEGGLASFLTVVGLQLRARQPELFPGTATLDEEVQVGVVERGANLTLQDIDRVIINPFTDLNLGLRAKAGRISGNLTVVRIGDIVDAAYAAPQALEPAALLGPARELAARDPDSRIVILLDGADELRLRDTSVDVLNWLADHPEFPANVRFVIASRPVSARLDQLTRGEHGPHVKQVNLDKFSADAESLAQRIAGDEVVQQVLARLGVRPAAFAAYAAKRSNGNFRYLTLLRAMVQEAVDDPGADLTWLAEHEDRWPDGLNALSRDYLLRTRDRVGRAARDEGAWERLYLPVLGMLAVAEAGLTMPQFEAYGGITAVGGETCATALDRLRQLLRVERGSYRFDHASTADFLLDEQAADALWVDPGRWHRKITDYAFDNHGADGSWGAADPYLLSYLPAHAEAVGQLDDLIEDPRFLMAPGLDLGDRGLLSLLGAVGRAKPIAQLIRQVLPMLRGRVAGTLPHLHLYATQAGLTAFADRVAALITDSSWSLLYTHWQPELVRGAIGQHAGAVNAIAVTRDDEGSLHAFTAGDDGVFKVWDLTTGTHLSAVGTSLEQADPRKVTAVAGGLGDAGTPVVVSGDSYGTLRAWDLAAGVAIGRPLESFSNCGRAIAAGAVRGVPLVLCRAGARLRVWDLRDRGPLGEPMPAGSVSVFDTLAGAMIETPGGGALVAVRLNPEVNSYEDDVQVWDPSTGEPRGLPVRATESATAIALAKPATDPGYAIVIGDIGGGVQVFDMDTGEQRWYHRVFDRPVTALAGGEFGGRQVIVSGDQEGKVRVWDLATGKLISGPHQVPDLDAGITAAAIIPSWDGGRLALAGKKHVPREDPYLDKLRDLAAKSADDSLAALIESSSRSVSITSERRIVITSRPGPGPGQPEDADRRRKYGKGKKNRKARSATGERPLTAQLVIRPDGVLHPDEVVRGMTVANGGDHRVLVATDGYQAGVWNLATGAFEDGPFCGPAVQVEEVAFVRVRDEQRAVGAIGGTLHAWGIQSGQEIGDPVVLADARISGLAVTDLDGTPIAVCTTFRDGAHVIDLDMMRPAAHWRDVDYLTSVAAGELEGRPVVVLGSHGSPRVVIADARTGGSLWSPPRGHLTPQVESVAAARHGGRTLIVSGGLDRTLHVWDPKDGADPQAIQVDGDVSCLAITEQDGDLVAVCGGGNGEVRVVGLLEPSPAPDAIPPVSAVAVSGDTLLCGTKRGLLDFSLATGTSRPVPQTVRAELRDVRAVTTGTLHNRPVAVALERYGRPCGYAWYLDDGTPIGSGWMPPDAEAVALARDGDQTLAIVGTFGGAVMVADLATGEQVRQPYTFHSRISHVGLTTVAGVPILVVGCHGIVFSRYLHDADREPWWQAAAPPIREDKALPNTDTAWATAIGDLAGRPFVACGNEDGKVAMYTFPHERLDRSPLTGSFDKISALAFSRLGGRPVLASGALDGTVRAWDLNDTATVITILTRAAVGGIALAEPDLCVVGTTKGILAVRLRFSGLVGGSEPRPESALAPRELRANP
ncbi:MAG TPA: AAA family ATPase [Streptosporangiaceae bacterium]|nr:AAA family ATPase [Streptosporangiaceae bacterium]